MNKISGGRILIIIMLASVMLCGCGRGMGVGVDDTVFGHEAGMAAGSEGNTTAEIEADRPDGSEADTSADSDDDAAIGCGDMAVDSDTDAPAGSAMSKNGKNNPAHAEAEQPAALWQEVYDQTPQTEETDHLKLVQGILHKMGEHGYTAVDSENQLDMVGTERVLRFCKSVDKRDEDKITIVTINTSNGFTTYALHTENGIVEVVKSSYRMEDGRAENISTAAYLADSWQYTKEGWLIFTGSSYSEESYVLTMSDVPEVTALRVEPLDAKCREFNRSYLLPVGYRRNNMFLCDWNEKDYGALDFYDVFDRCYPLVYGQPVPYTADENITVGSVYHIPEREFEDVAALHLSVDAGTLRAKTGYLPEEKAYVYRPRGFHEVEYANLPYPEVVDYEEQADGTIILTVNAVYPSEGTSKAFSHEVVVRPLGQDGFQYVSNARLPSKDDYGTGWHTDRLTDEEWEEIYGQSPLD